MARTRGITEPAANAAIDTACRVLRLPTIRSQFAEMADKAEREQLTYRGFLAELFMAECEDRDRRRAERRLRAAGFPRQKWLKDFDYDANPNINPAVIAALETCDWITKGAPLCLIGDSGTGKSHLLIGLGTAAAMTGHRVHYVLASKFVNKLVEAADDRQLTKTIARYGRVDLLCVDELGYMELDRRGAELLFQVLTEREEKASVAIASNESFSKAHMFQRTCVKSCRNFTGSARAQGFAADVVPPRRGPGLLPRPADRRRDLNGSPDSELPSGSWKESWWSTQRTVPRRAPS
jgi:DNA replication protein DnaC